MVIAVGEFSKLAVEPEVPVVPATVLPEEDPDIRQIRKSIRMHEGKFSIDDAKAIPRAQA